MALKRLLVPIWILFLVSIVLVAPVEGQVFLLEGGSYGGIYEYSLSGASIGGSNLGPPGTALVPEDFPSSIAATNGLIYLAYESQGSNTDTISTFNAATGAVVNPSLLTGFGNQNMLVASGNTLYDYNFSGSIGEYNATTGANVGSLSTGTGVLGFAISGTTGYVVQNSFSTNSNIFRYNLTTGTKIGSALVSGLYGPGRPVIVGNTMYVESQGAPNTQGYYTPGFVGTYNATTGAAISAQLITGLNDPSDLSVVGSDIFVSAVNDQDQDVLEEYSTSGSLLSSSLISSGLGEKLDVLAVPETSSFSLCLCGLAAFVILSVRRRLV